MRRPPFPAATLPATLLLAVAGCGPASQFPETVPVSGRVTFKGQPLTTGTVTFQSDRDQVATGRIGPDGTFQLSTFAEKDGAVPGHHRVMIIANDGDPTLMPSSPGYKPPKDLIPKKYAALATSGLQAEVSKDKPTVGFDLN